MLKGCIQTSKVNLKIKGCWRKFKTKRRNLSYISLVTLCNIIRSKTSSLLILEYNPKLQDRNSTVLDYSLDVSILRKDIDQELFGIEAPPFLVSGNNVIIISAGNRFTTTSRLTTPRPNRSRLVSTTTGLVITFWLL